MYTTKKMHDKVMYTNKYTVNKFTCDNVKQTCMEASRDDELLHLIMVTVNTVRIVRSAMLLSSARVVRRNEYLHLVTHRS